MERMEVLRLYDHHSDEVYRLAYSYLMNRDDAQDIVQEVFLRLLEKNHSIKTESEDGGKVRQINTYFVKDNILYHIYADVWAQESGRADIPINDFLVILDEIEECVPIN